MILIVSALIVSPVMGEPSPAHRSSQVVETRVDSVDVSPGARWGLSDEEWSRYKNLMEGPRGIWSPDLDPISTLGIHARNDRERDKYAEMAVKLERARVQAELDFQYAYDDACVRLFGEQACNQVFVSSQWDRLQWHGHLNAPTEGLRSVLAYASRNRIPLDLFIDGAKDDSEIREWAVQMDVDPEKVLSGNITLNHNRGNVRSAVPAVFGVVNGTPSPIPFERFQ